MSKCTIINVKANSFTVVGYHVSLTNARTRSWDRAPVWSLHFLLWFPSCNMQLHSILLFGISLVKAFVVKNVAGLPT